MQAPPLQVAPVGQNTFDWFLKPGSQPTGSSNRADKTLILLRGALTAGLTICFTNVHTYCEIECFIEFAYPTGERWMEGGGCEGGRGEGVREGGREGVRKGGKD